MPVDPKKKWDVFVSYAHPDNLAIGPVDGWVTNFIQYLRNLLVQATGYRDLTVWHDANMKASEKFEGAIADAISNSAVFLIVFSPSWRSSEYCLKELDWFNKSVGPAGASVGDFSRIVTARRGDVPFNEWPAEIKEQHDPVAFNDPGQPLIPLAPSDPAFLQRLGTLAEGIKAVLFAMKARREANIASDEVHSANAPVAPDGVPTLYMATTTPLAKERDIVTGDLEQLCKETGATIRITRAGAGSPEGATLSLHMFSGDQDTAATTELEAALALPLPYRPLVWLPKSVNIDEVDSKSQTKLLESLRDNGRPPNSPAGNTIEFFHADIEELKSELHRRLAPPKSPVRSTMRIRGKRRQLIYVSHKGEGTMLPSLEKLFDHGQYEIWSLDHGSPNAEAMHKSTLENCDGFAVVYGPATIDWAETITHQALLSSRGNDRPRALAAVELPPPPSRPFANRADTLVQIYFNPTAAANDVGPFLSVLEDSNG